MIFLIKTILSEVFSLLVKFRIFLYKVIVFKQSVFNIKIISIGNLSFGGTGKTPLTVALLNHFSKNKKVAVLEKGYKSKLLKNEVLILDKNSKTSEFEKIGDEANLINLNNENSKLIVSKNKTFGVKTFLQNNTCDLLLVDDGFQHFRLARNLDVVLIDANTSFNDSLFPKGKLREPYSSLKRADILLFTKSNFISEFEKDRLTNVALSYNLNLKIFFINSKPNFNNLNLLEHKNIIVISAIAEPCFFHKLLESENFNITQKITYQDHYAYTIDDIKHLEAVKLSTKCKSVVTTSKDFTKLKKFSDNFLVIDYEHELSVEFYEHIDAVIWSKDVKTF